MLPSFSTLPATPYLDVRELGRLLIPSRVSFRVYKAGNGLLPPIEPTSHVFLADIDKVAKDFLRFRISCCATEQLAFGGPETLDGVM